MNGIGHLAHTRPIHQHSLITSRLLLSVQRLDTHKDGHGGRGAPWCSSRKWVFRPNTAKRCAWDLWIMLLVVFYAFLVPVRVAFYKTSLYAAEETVDWIADG